MDEYNKFEPKMQVFYSVQVIILYLIKRNSTDTNYHHADSDHGHHCA